jgi:DNA polymerase-1
LRYLFKIDPGRTLVECDYSNIEMHLAAEISGEPILLRLYNEGADLHKVTAAKVIGEESLQAVGLNPTND